MEWVGSGFDRGLKSISKYTIALISPVNLVFYQVAQKVEKARSERLCNPILQFCRLLLIVMSKECCRFGGSIIQILDL